MIKKKNVYFSKLDINAKLKEETEKKMNTENFALSASSLCCCASSFLYDTFLQQIFNFICQKQFFFVVMGYSGLLLENSKDKPETEKA